MSDQQDPVPAADAPLILRLEEGMAAFAVLARIESHLVSVDAEPLVQALYGVGRDGGQGHLPAVKNFPAAPEIADRETAIEYVRAVKERLRRRETLGEWFSSRRTSATKKK